MKLILSIGKRGDFEQEGIISLWDVESSVPNNEHKVILELTPEQEKQLIIDGVRPINILDWMK